ncbi:MAG: tripartite tricarboxylate transporter TctB family protein [Paracoccaceae bacterium]|jgi:putative tricarboxylic transport membrane protein|uniref:tripartite tricarboxylate transporter TctB family protein n=1 Tax=unclassified Seohaeicola TaxID=2641111 RepID=UPI00237ADD42|nr:MULTISPECIES: tripartite tricarboxylate transporter TctB family protein [unclassified Seohaeicola]MDD9707313.1 tripartite tricarboxylate transporter TctB family protein [Seohaeicola sp. 4SK31]MDD9735712.1 tripartite tricarboxylate transporter TctB family protein [Seohaeicola sp. SP36]MDF1707038.1 tripartite tricarboxylate transporter TctB family protein [Paracoccaceae bacterium]MDM7969849.1 tripartite tricarboxylate transporter TctB family protein [Paracoccaceae bacterium]
MPADRQETAGETRLSADQSAPEVRLHGEDEVGQGSGLRDLAGLGIAAGLFALALVIYGDASSYPVRRSYAQFGPEIFPYIIAFGIVVLAGFTAVIAWRGGFEARARLNYSGLFWIVAAIVTEIIMLFAGTGFIAASTVLFAFSARAFGQTTHLLNFAIGAVMSTLLFLLFRYGLGLALPNGPLERSIDLLLR